MEMGFIFFVDQSYDNMQKYKSFWDQKKYLDKLNPRILLLFDMVHRYVTSYFSLSDLIANKEVIRCLNSNEFQIYSAIDEEFVKGFHEKYGIEYEVQYGEKEALLPQLERNSKKINEERAKRDGTALPEDTPKELDL